MNGKMDLSYIQNVLSGVESSLQCGICYDFLNTAMMTPCSHNYCSLCIRKYMTYKSECPTCFKETAEPQLLNNRILDELVHKFQEVRAKLLNALKGLETSYSVQAENSKQTLSIPSGSCPPLKRTRNSLNDSSSEDAGTSSGSVRAHRRASQQQKRKLKAGKVIPYADSKKNSEPFGQQHQHPSSQDDDDFINDQCPGSKVLTTDKVPCPVCSVEVPTKSINHHVEACLLRCEKRETLRRTSCKKQTRTHLPKLVYRLLSDKDLRKKLKEQGLSTVGNRETLIKRHQAFKIAYNAECDSLNPRPVSEIIKQVQKQEEKVIGAQSTAQSVLPFNRKSHLSVIETEQKKYLAAHKSHFDKLINNARAKHKGNKCTIQKVADSANSSDTEVLEDSSLDSDTSISLMVNVTSANATR